MFFSQLPLVLYSSTELLPQSSMPLAPTTLLHTPLKFMEEIDRTEQFGAALP